MPGDSRDGTERNSHLATGYVERLDGPMDPVGPPPFSESNSEKMNANTPPLSAAQSQVSLATSDLTVSDPDLATSSSYGVPSSATSSLSSSRPPSSSGLTSPDLLIQQAECYTPENGDFPLSPPGVKNGNCPTIDVSCVEDEALPNCTVASDFANNCTNSSSFLSPSTGGSNFDVPSDVEEDYFEEFHLPNTHEKAFVRHHSFRRKVQLTPINAPDAEKIEGLVRTGEFHRHGSIRRRILPEMDETGCEGYSEDECRNNKKSIGNGISGNNNGSFEENIKEIECMLKEDEKEVRAMTNENRSPANRCNQLTVDEVQSGRSVIHTHTSTPKTEGGSSSNISGCPADITADISASLTESSYQSPQNSADEDNLNIEQSTLMKIKECLDVSKYKDMYNLSGRLQDILTPKEVEEILNNSEKYTEYIDQDVLEALSNSFQEKVSASLRENNLDSGISSQRNFATADSSNLFNACIDTAVHEESLLPSASIPTEMDVGDDDEVGLRFERRRSLRRSKDLQELEVEGVFVESKSRNSGLKKIAAPVLDLSIATNEENESCDYSIQGLDYSPSQSPKEGAENDSTGLPIIKVRSASEYEDSGTSHLLVDGSSLSDITPGLVDDCDRLMRIKGSAEEDSSELVDEIVKMKKICVSTDILQSPDDDEISIASQFSQHSDVYCDDGLSNISSQLPDSIASSHIQNRASLSQPVPPPPAPLISELSAADETAEERHWRSIVIGGTWRRIDMKVIAPYRKCVSHGGYVEKNNHAVILVSSCYLPSRSRRDYNYVMDNLLLYVLSTLEQLVTDDYILVYLADGGQNNSGPGFHWLKTAYQMIDRKLRKNLKALHVVHPTLWVRTVVAFSRPFISSKFYRKLTFISNLTELAQIVPLDQLDIPASVKQADFELMIREKKRNLGKRKSITSSR